jgi:hypothetical protein
MNMNSPRYFADWLTQLIHKRDKHHGHRRQL